MCLTKRLLNIKFMKIVMIYNLSIHLLISSENTTRFMILEIDNPDDDAENLKISTIDPNLLYCQDFHYPFILMH